MLPRLHRDARTEKGVLWEEEKKASLLLWPSDVLDFCLGLFLYHFPIFLIHIHCLGADREKEREREGERSRERESVWLADLLFLSLPLEPLLPVNLLATICPFS